jgi:tetratricopeptide (TPR) repeat protein
MSAELHRHADAALAQGRIAEAIAILEGLSLSDPGDFPAWIKLATLYRRGGEIQRALDAVNAALASQPNEFLALLLKGSLHEQLGEGGRAAEVYRAAVFHAESLPQIPTPVAQQLDRARNFLGAWRAGVVAQMPVLEGISSEHRARAERLIENALDRRAIYHQEPTHYRYPGLADIEYFDHAYGELRERLRQAYPDIRAEFEALIARHGERQTPYVDFAPGQPMGQWAPLNRSPDWNVFHLIRYGEIEPLNAAACPRTLEAMVGPHQPDVAGITPNLMFSLLAPRTRIPPHHGVANFRVVLHLPLIVPRDCFFRVGADTRQWVEGEPWVFDDCIEHEAWNDSDELRVVLIADLWRPELDGTDRSVIREFIAAQAINSDIGAL